MSLRASLEKSVVGAVMALPDGVKQRLAGRPVVLDGQTLSVETQLMLRLQRVTRLPGAETLPIGEGRVAIDHQSEISRGDHPIGAVRDLDVDGLPARLYTPRSGVGEVTPMLVFLHGGGFIYGGLDSHDGPCRVLAERAGVRVLAIDYRLAPEHPFPAAYDDAVTAYRWAVKNADSLGADATRLAVGGDSAGGNLAIGVAVAAAREGLPLAFQLLVYPATDSVERSNMRSYQLFGEGFFLTARFMELATDSYTPDPATLADPRVSPAYETLPADLAPAYVATAGFDPLRDEGEAFARRLADAGVSIELRRFPDQIHGFFNLTGVGRSAPRAIEEIADALRRGLAAPTA